MYAPMVFKVFEKLFYPEIVLDIFFAYLKLLTKSEMRTGTILWVLFSVISWCTL